MKNLIYLLVIAFSLFFLTACPDNIMEEGSFKFYNNSDRNIYMYLGIATRESGGTLYPDTMISEVQATVGPILKNGFYRYQYRRFKDCDTLCLYIFDADTVEKYSWDDVKLGYMIIKRYDLDFTNDLKEFDYTIYYPPTPIMKEIPMYPPYED